MTHLYVFIVFVADLTYVVLPETYLFFSVTYDLPFFNVTCDLFLVELIGDVPFCSVRVGHLPFCSVTCDLPLCSVTCDLPICSGNYDLPL